jgi:hypothetical protein
MVGGPAHGPRVDVVQLAACVWAPALVTLAILKELFLAILIETGMVLWSPAGRRASLPKMEVMGTT